MKWLWLAVAVIAIAALVWWGKREAREEEIALAESPVGDRQGQSKDPEAQCTWLEEQPWMTHIFDTTTIPEGPWYVNDHTIVHAPDGLWHMFGIFNREPMGADNEVAFIHAIAKVGNPASWAEGSFLPADPPIALRANPAIGESHLWAPHVMKSGDRWLMFYNGGGKDDDHASIRIAESADLYDWRRITEAPVFEDFCAARDPMVTEREGTFFLYYTRCESLSHKVSGVALRTSKDLLHWSDPKMALTLGEDSLMPNSGYSESPFVFQRRGVWMMSITEYPREWDGTYLYRSIDPTLFSPTPFAKLRAHAAEWIFDDDRAWLTHAGPGQGGVWMARVKGL